MNPEVSSFIPPKDIVPIDTSDKDVHRIFQDLFCYNGRVPHHYRLLGYHPTFLKLYNNAYSNLMKDEGSLPLNYRNYIAIMV